MLNDIIKELEELVDNYEMPPYVRQRLRILGFKLQSVNDSHKKDIESVLNMIDTNQVEYLKLVDKYRELEAMFNELCSESNKIEELVLIGVLEIKA